MKYEVPGTARKMIEHLIQEQAYKVKQIAQMLGVSRKTIYRILKGHSPHPKIHLNIIQLYLCLQQKLPLEIEAIYSTTEG